MNSAFFALTREALTSSLRQFSFRFLLLLAALGAIGSALICEWTAEDPRRVFFNAMAWILEGTGGWLAISLGLKLSRQDRDNGTRATLYALPINRGQWALSRSLGVTCTLLLFAMVALAWTQGSMILFGLGPLTNPDRIMLLFLLLFWILMGHVSLLLGEMFSRGLALFLLLSLWFMGEMAGPFFGGIEGSESFAFLQKYVHYFWQIDRLFLVGTLTSPLSLGLPSLDELLVRAGHAVALCGFCLSLFWLLVRRNRLPRL